MTNTGGIEVDMGNTCTHSEHRSKGISSWWYWYYWCWESRLVPPIL